MRPRGTTPSRVDRRSTRSCSTTFAILQKKGNKAANGFENAICDSRVDFAEVSTQCLSYGYANTSVTPVSGTIRTQASPLLPTLRPLDLFTNLFGSFVPPTTGGPTPAVLKALHERKSVLDFALRELAQLSTLAPASERSKIDIHAQAIRDIETQISMQLQGTGGPAMGCTAPAMPPAVSGGASDKGNHNDYGNPVATVADDTLHAQIGGLHMGILKAAFTCDIIRVATFQWSPGTNHVAFKGQFPGEANTIYQHHPLSHRIGTVRHAGHRHRAPSRGRVLDQRSDLVQHPDGDRSSPAGRRRPTSWGGICSTTRSSRSSPRSPPPATSTPTCRRCCSAVRRSAGSRDSTWALNNRPLNDLWLTIAQSFGLTTGAAPFSNELLVKNTAGWTGPIAEPVGGAAALRSSGAGGGRRAHGVTRPGLSLYCAARGKHRWRRAFGKRCPRIRFA